jgi:zinc transport system ATP-binding protein
MPKAAPPSVALRFTDVSFSYESVHVLRNANFHIHEGEFIALVGANGAGKTTVLKLILGLEQPSSGSIQLYGSHLSEARHRIGFVPQYAAWDTAFPVSVKDVVKMGRLKPLSRHFTKADSLAVQQAMQLAQVEDLAKRSYSELSGGQRRRVLVARALASEPDLLILDEPTANMDTASEERLLSTLQELKGSTTIIMVTHDTGFVSALTDSVLCVGEHKVRDGISSIVRHGTAPGEHAPPELFGGKALKVLHDSHLPEDACCRDKEPHND